MEKYSLAMLVHIAQVGDPESRAEAFREIERRGFDFEDLHEQFNS